MDRNRLRHSCAAVVAAARAIGAAVGTVIGAEEAPVLVGLVLLTVGLWPVLQQTALTVPGAVLVYVFLPMRKPFIERPAADRPSRRTE